MTETTSLLTRITDVRRAVWLAYAVLLGFLVVFMAWAASTPLSSAAIAQGTVGVEGQRKAIQHLQGGVVEHIHVRDGDRVAAGDLLVELSGVSVGTQYDELDQRAIELAAALARWRAERANKDTVETTAALASHEERGLVERSLETQQELLEVRRAVHRESLKRFALQRDQAREDAVALESRLETLLAKRRLIEHELEEQRALEEQGLITRADVFELEKEQADLRLDVEATRADLVRLRQQSLSLEAEAAELKGKRRQEIVEQLTLVRGELQAIRQQLRNFDYERNSLALRAPIDGIVLNLSLHTVGGVAPAGQTLMEIVPAGQRLLVECQVPARDRESVAVGQAAEVRLSAFDKRSTRPLPGRVQTISADSLSDPLTGERYYRTTVALEGEATVNGSPLFPGMQAEVLINTGEQTLLGYLTAPLARSFNRALREG